MNTTTKETEQVTPSGLGVPASALLILGVGAVSLVAAPFLPGVNEVVMALVLGLVIANVGKTRTALASQASSFMLKRALKLAVILLGAGINVALIRAVGFPALVVITGSVITGMGVSWLVARQQRLGTRPALLVGIGTAICGASAIAAVAPVVKAKQEEIGVALGTVLGFNAIALVLYPIIGGLAGWDPAFFGTWAGTAVHDTATSVATGFAMGPEAGEVATVVKLARILFLIPMLAVIAGGVAVHDATEGAGIRGAARTIWKSVPWFVFGFAALAAANSFGWLGAAAEVLSDTAKLIIVFVVAAIGLTLQLGQVAHLGRKTFITGFAASATVAVVSLLLIKTMAIGG